MVGALLQAYNFRVIAMCSCDSTDADMGSLGFVLLHLTGVENINAKSELNDVYELENLVDMK